MPDINRLNDILQRAIAEFISREVYFPDVLITVVAVECSPDLQYLSVFVSVLPDKFFGSALETLKKNNVALSAYLKKTVKIRKIPKFVWKIDNTEKKAAELEEYFKQI